MEFGDKNSFAVEFDLDENHGGAWLFGKFCYWIDGVQVGDYELGTSLRDVLFQMKWIVYDCGNRDGEILCNLNPHKAFSILEEALYESNESDSRSESELLDSPARFEIKIPVDIFDHWKAYLFECGNKALILFKNTNNPNLNLVTIDSGIFDNAIKEAYDFLNKLYEQELL